MKSIARIITCLLFIGLLLNCSGTKDDIPQAILKGHVKGIPAEKIDLKINVSNSITGDVMYYYIPVDSTGEFQLSLPLAFPVMATIESRYIGVNIIRLSPGKTSILNLDVDKDDKGTLQISDGIKAPASERSYLYSKIRLNIFESEDIVIDSLMAPLPFREYTTKRIAQTLSSVDSDTILSDWGKSVLKTELDLFYTNNTLIEYKSFMERVTSNNGLKNQTAEEPDLSYYSFLKDLNMSDTAVISAGYYHIILQNILKNPVFELKPINDTQPAEWVSKAKEKLGGAVGEGQELFYNILLANSYSNQLNQMQPFNEKQIKNIESYYKEDNIGKVLISENHKVNILLSENVDKKPTEVGAEPKEEAPNTDQAELFMSRIFDKHKDKVIVVDFWATWCVPCVKSIEEIAPYKKKYQNKGVVFVYITTESSPPKTWEIMKKNIKGEHYYVDEKMWDQLSDKYGVNSIPYILVFGKDKKVKKQISGYIEGDKSLTNSLDELL